MTEPTSSQRRFTVIELPVLSIVKQSLILPFRHLPELVKFGGIPFLGILVVDAIAYMLAREDVAKSLPTLILALGHFILFTPFCVAWSRLAILGPASIANAPPFAYSRRAWLYLLASISMSILLMICIGPGFILARYIQQTLDNRMGAEAAVLLLGGLFIFALIFVRLAFIFPAIAIGRYAGISAAWRQTAGNLERLTAMIVLSYIPYFAVRRIFEWSMGYHPPGVVEAIRGCGDMLLVALATTAVAAPALAYKTIVLDEAQATSAITESIRTNA